MKAIMLIVALALVTTGAFSQTSPKKTAKTPPPPVPSGVLKKGNSVWILKPLQDNETMDNGLTVKPNGNVRTASGKTFTLQDGDCISTDGKVVGLNEKNLTSAIVKKGKMWVATRVQQDMQLSDGSTVTPDGTLKKKDGTVIPLKNDQIFDIAVTE